MQHIKRAVESSIRKIRIGIMGMITSVKKDGTVFIETSNDEELRDIKLISPYGLYSLPINGSTGQIIFNNTSKKATLVGIEQLPPIEINPGETIVFNNAGHYIYLKEDGIHVNGNLYISNGDIIKK